MLFDFDISIIICTYNRAQMLNDTLASWHKVDKSNINVELIVIDNNSSDATADVVKAYQNSNNLAVAYFYESNIGLSFARNRGIKESRGHIIAFIDDDVYIDRHWLQEIRRIFNDNPDIHCIGGNSVPVFETVKPDWINDRLLKMYGATLSGNREKPMHYPNHPFGVNMAFRRIVFERAGMFNPRLGRIKKSLLSNEEKELFYRIDQMGLKTRYTPKAIIYHRVPEDRLQPDWIVKRYFGQGLSKVAFNQITIKKGRLALFKDAIVYFKRAILGTQPFSLQKTFLHYRHHSMTTRMQSAMFLGMAKQSFMELF